MAYALFFLAGLGFGFAALGMWKWLPLAFPLALFLGAVWQSGVDGTGVVRLVVALLVTAAGIVAGALLERRGDRDAGPRYA
jgi:hypothetical protein